MFSWKDVSWGLLVMAGALTVLFFRAVWTRGVGSEGASFWSTFLTATTFAETCVLTMVIITVVSVFRMIQGR